MRNGRKIILLGEVLANESIGVFIQAQLPGIEEMGEVDLAIQCLGNIMVPCKLAAIIGGQGVNPGASGLSKRMMAWLTASAVFRTTLAIYINRDLRSTNVTSA